MSKNRIVSMPLAVVLCRPSDVPAPAGSRIRWEDFFLPSGRDPSNCVTYWTDLSYGQYDAGGSRVFDWIDIGHTRAEISAFSGVEQRLQLAAWGREAAGRAGIRLADFKQVVFGYNINADHGSVGRNSIVLAYAEGRPFEPTFMHHEFGHALGLGHSSSQNNGVYWDIFDIMSAMNVWTFQDVRGRTAGPGAAVPNLENLGWLDRSRVWQTWPTTPQTLTLAALNRPAVNGYLAARFQFPAPSNKVYYLEYREATVWDRGLPGPRVLVHTRNAENGPEIIGGGYNPAGALQAGQQLELLHSPSRLVVRVESIDVASSRAAVRVSAYPIQPRVSIGPTPIQYQVRKTYTVRAVDPFSYVAVPGAVDVYPLYNPSNPRPSMTVRTDQPFTVAFGRPVLTTPPLIPAVRVRPDDQNRYQTVLRIVSSGGIVRSAEDFLALEFESPPAKAPTLE